MTSEAADDCADTAVFATTTLTREELAITGPLALFDADPDAYGPAEPGPRVPSRRAEVTRVAGAIVAAGLVGWAAYGPIHSAANSVREPVPSPSGTQRPSPPHPGPVLGPESLLVTESDK